VVLPLAVFANLSHSGPLAECAGSTAEWKWRQRTGILINHGIELQAMDFTDGFGALRLAALMVGSARLRPEPAGFQQQLASRLAGATKSFEPLITRNSARKPGRPGHGKER